MANIYLLKEGKQQGPYTEGQVRHMLSSGLASPKDMGWHAELTEWIPVGLIVVETSSNPLKKCSGSIVINVSKNLFRGMVVLSIVFFIAFLLASLNQPSAAEGQSSGQSSSDQIWGMIILIIIMFPSYLGLLLIKKWGRNLFIVTIAIILVVTLFCGSVTESPTANALGTLSDMLNGAILAVLFFTPVLNTSLKIES
jgi:hypothetical protein